MKRWRQKAREGPQPIVPLEREYLVVWELNVTASSPREAAETARAIHLDPTSGALVYSVSEARYEVDLADYLPDQEEQT